VVRHCRIGTRAALDPASLDDAARGDTLELAEVPHSYIRILYLLILVPLYQPNPAAADHFGSLPKRSAADHPCSSDFGLGRLCVQLARLTIRCVVRRPHRSFRRISKMGESPNRSAAVHTHTVRPGTRSRPLHLAHCILPYPRVCIRCPPSTLRSLDSPAMRIELA
jgi:hypothetical protein